MNPEMSDYSETVPCKVCGADCPAPLGICPGPLDGSLSECARIDGIAQVRAVFSIGPQEMFRAQK